MKKLVWVLVIVLLFSSCTSKPMETPKEDNSSKAIGETEINSGQTKPEISESSEIKIDRRSINTPILIGNLLMGGLSKGEWVTYEEFLNNKVCDLKGFIYDIYVDDRKVSEGIGGQLISPFTDEELQDDKIGYPFVYVKVLDKENQEINFDIAMKADWDLFPRQYQELNTSQEVYLNLVKKYLEKAGLENPNTMLKQVIKVDLEGDGVDEVLVAANNTVGDELKEVKSGDNAILIFRRLVNGQVIDTVLGQDIRRQDEAGSIYRIWYEVDTIADLDADGIMEVVIRAWYYEGEEWLIYKLIDNKLEWVAGNGFGV